MMDDNSAPHLLADSDQMMDSVLLEEEERRALERATRTMAEITIDLIGQGPLHDYLVSRRELAKKALTALMDHDPRDNVGIARLQGEVGEYLKVCEWIGARYQDSEEADRTIQEEYNNG